jgi:tetratricopeptide (TPR) repeat protein
LAHVREAAAKDATYRFHSAHNLVGTLGGILEGEIHRAEGDLDMAIASFQSAVALQDAMIYDEPEPLPFAARHWLGAALLEAKRYPDAERVYREDLSKHPRNGWSLLGLKTALDAQGKPSAELDRQFQASWARSDTWIRASRF